jgi:hypothetical protein
VSKFLRSMYDDVAKRLRENGDGDLTGELVATKLHSITRKQLSFLEQRQLTLLEEQESSISSQRRHLRNFSKLNPSSVGSRGEEVWIKFFELFLPDGYTVVQTAHLIDRDNAGSPQIDILILKPGYPKIMINEGYYPLESVLAGFECKLSLTLADVRSTVEKAKRIKQMFQHEHGSIESELATPFVYGLVALGDSISVGEKCLLDKVHDLIVDESEDFEDPTHLLDLLIVPNKIFLGLKNLIDYQDRAVDIGYEYVECDPPYSGPLENPLGRFYLRFLEKLPYVDGALRHQLQLYSFLGGHATSRYMGKLRRTWEEIFSCDAISHNNSQI